MSSKNIGQVEDEYHQQFLLKAQKETQCEEGKAAAIGALECGGKEVVVNIITINIITINIFTINIITITINIIKEVGAILGVNIITINIITIDIIITITSVLIITIALI